MMTKMTSLFVEVRNAGVERAYYLMFATHACVYVRNDEEQQSPKRKLDRWLLRRLVLEMLSTSCTLVSLNKKFLESSCGVGGERERETFHQLVHFPKWL